MTLVMVEWSDAYSFGGWHTPSKELDQTANCISIGLLLFDDGDQVTIAQSKSVTSGNIGDTLSIPKCSIKRIRKLKVK